MVASMRITSRKYMASSSTEDNLHNVVPSAIVAAGTVDVEESQQQLQQQLTQDGGSRSSSPVLPRVVGQQSSTYAQPPLPQTQPSPSVLRSASPAVMAAAAAIAAANDRVRDSPLLTAFTIQLAKFQSGVLFID